MTVDETGLDKESDLEEKNLMQQFIDYIKVFFGWIGFNSVY